MGHNAVSQVNQIPVIQRNIRTDPWQWQQNVLANKAKKVHNSA